MAAARGGVFSRRTWGFTSLVLTAVACAPPDEAGPAPLPVEPSALFRVAPEVAAAVSSGVGIDALLVLDTATVAPAPRANLRTSLDEVMTRRALAFAVAKQDLLVDPPPGLDLVSDFEQLPLAVVRVASLEALERLSSDPRVLRVAVDEPVTASLGSTLPFIRQSEALAEGKNGAGVTVAVLDTGADYRVAGLGSCTAPGVPSETCKVAYALDLAAEDGLLDDALGHGTNVSAIVAGVAPGARIIALDVFTGSAGYQSTVINAINWVIANRATWNIAAMNLSLGFGAFTTACPSSAMAVALNEARNAGVLAAVATGNNAYTNAIADPACGPAAVSVGAVYDSSLPPVGYSGCSDASSFADKVTCFSNSASFMTMLAPGAQVSAGGKVMSGTSQATPHVAGAIAVIRSAFPTETADDVVTRLTTSGVSVTDSRNGITKPRLDLAAAAAGCVFSLPEATRSIPSAASAFGVALATSSSCAWTATSSASWLAVGTMSGSGAATLQLSAAANPGASRSATLTIAGAGATRTLTVIQGVDTTPPTGTVLINGGDAWTRATTVALTLSATDPSGVTQMCVSNAATCSTWEAFASSKTWTLAATQGLRTVSVFLRDSRGNTTSTPITDTISLDTAAPPNVVPSGTVGDRSMTLSWAAVTDLTSRLAKYRAVYATTTAPASCQPGVGTLAWEGPGTTFTQTGLTNGVAYGWRVCSVDAAGNISAGTVVTATVRPESSAPVGSVLINGGDVYTKVSTVALTLPASDATGVAQVCLSTGTSCTAWQPWASSLTFSLGSAQGLRTVSAWFRDPWGNTSTTAVKDTIILDALAPPNPIPKAVSGDGSITLTWAAVTDTASGTQGYRVVFAPTTAPASCAAGVGTLLYEGTDLSFTHSGLANGTTYAYRVCTLDRAGNLSAGAAVATYPRPEWVAPVGSITVADGAATTRTATVSVSLEATDDSSVTQVCLSTGTTCTAWRAYAATLSFSLGTTQGLRTVSAWFRDPWGNTSTTAVKDTILLDTLAPPNPVPKAVSGDGSITLTWAAVRDTVSGTQGYRVVFAPTTAPASCAEGVGTLAYEGPDLSFTHSGLTNGTTYAYRVCSLDVAGNVSTGATVATYPRPEWDAPAGSITVADGAAMTRTPTVSVALSATDASSVTHVCLSTGTTCTAWLAYAPTLSFSLGTAPGLRTVSAWFRDAWGNTSTAAVTDSILFDATPPTNPTMTATAGSQQVSFSWTAATDAVSGVSGYRLVAQQGTVPPAAQCTNGTLVYSGTELGSTHSSLTAGMSIAYRLCVIDEAGNVNAGVTAVRTPTP